MKRTMRISILGWSTAVLLVLASCLAGSGTGTAQQQEAPDEGAVAMGSQSRMVRGTVTAASADHLTVKTDAGDIYQVVVTTNTRMTKERQPVKLADVHVGDGVGAMGVIDAPTKTIHAAMLMVVDAAQIKKMKEDMGKTYISGKVLAINDLELTVHRPDGVDQKITVDEGTSFKKGGRGAAMAMRGDGSAGIGPEGAGGGQGQGPRGGASEGESITLADIKVGDTVIGPGALKDGVFVPTKLTVIDAASMGRRRHREGGGEDGSPPAPGETTTAPPGTNPH